MVHATPPDSSQAHEDAVQRVLGSADAPGEPGIGLNERVRRAADEFDARTAEELGWALRERLTAEPADSQVLEALLVLGLAFSPLFVRIGLSLSQEGRRLAVILEKAGATERAQTLLEVMAARQPGDRAIDRDLAGLMRRSGNGDRLVERYLRRAEGAVGEGRLEEALRWLQDALMVDRSRMDVARMIRDLRYDQESRRNGGRRFLRNIGVGLLVASAVGGLAWREWDLHRRFAELPTASDGALSSLRARLLGVEALIEHNPAWLGVVRAAEERASLRREIATLEAASAAERQTVARAQNERREEAEVERLRGRAAVERGDFAGALACFRRALGQAPSGWDERPRVEADVEALERWIAENPDPHATGGQR